MTISSLPYQATYFRDLAGQDDVEIDLQYLLSFPEGVFVEKIYPFFCQALKANSGLVLSNNLRMQASFTKYMTSRGCNYSSDDLNLDLIIKSIRDKAKMQVEYELTVFNLEDQKIDEAKCQNIADVKWEERQSTGRHAEFLTLRQVRHMIYLVLSFGRLKRRRI